MLNALNIFFAVVFVLEFLLKVIGLGFTSYFSSAWNWLDVGIIVVSSLTLVKSDQCLISSYSNAAQTNVKGSEKKESDEQGTKVVIV